MLIVQRCTRISCTCDSLRRWVSSLRLRDTLSKDRLAGRLPSFLRVQPQFTSAEAFVMTGPHHETVATVPCCRESMSASNKLKALEECSISSRDFDLRSFFFPPSPSHLSKQSLNLAHLGESLPVTPTRAKASMLPLPYTS
jgi:hypothetical protein